MWQYTKWALFTGITLLPLALTYYLNSRLDCNLSDEDYWYDFIFITHKNANCFKHVRFKEPCSDYCSAVQMEKIKKLFSGAKSSISLCIYLLTLEEVANELIACHRRGVRVRVITDYEMIPCGNNAINNLKRNGVVVKTQGNARNLMHHKFAVIDIEESTRKVSYGSLNYSMQALLKNYENVIITNNELIARDLMEEFEYLWNNFVTY